MPTFFTGLIVFLFFNAGIVQAQNDFRARVVSSSGQALSGVQVFFKSGAESLFTDSTGQFSFPEALVNDSILLVAKGYVSANALLSAEKNLIFSMDIQGANLKEVEIRAYRPAGYIARREVALTQVITSMELKKAACCDLSGCFETSMAVTPQVTNVITRSKELRILGLSGTNNQVLIDGFPMVYGLSFPYGVSSYPGTIIKDIFVSKGAGSVVQSFEGFAGQINMITHNGDNDERLFVNLYANNFGEKQANFHQGLQKNGHRFFSSVHVVSPSMWMDGDGDGFSDMPQIRRLHVSSKWEYENPEKSNWTTRTGFRMVGEERVGGQHHFDPKTESGSTSKYGQAVNYRQPEFFTRTARKFGDSNEVIAFSSLALQNQDSWYGTLRYRASQALSWSQLQWERKVDLHTSVVGASFRYFDIKENISFNPSTVVRNFAGDYNRIDRVAGIFTEQTFSIPALSADLIAGLRADEYLGKGSHVVPRVLFRTEMIEGWVLRLNSGMGWRIANPFSENIILLAGNRDLVIAPNLRTEKAINHGGSLTREIETINLEGSITLDYYHTRVRDQVFPDYDTDASVAYLNNYTGLTISHAAQLEGRFRVADAFDCTLGYSFLEVFRRQNHVKNLLPFNTRNRILAVVSIPLFSERCKIDVNAHGYGKQRLPDTSKLPDELKQPAASKPYAIYSAQVTWIFKNLELYVGCENLSGFRQRRPILGWQDPFGKYFDPSFAWGPNRGREIYAGLRWKLLRNPG